MFKKLIIATLFVASSIYAGSINIAVAANVSYAIDEIKKEFNKLYPKTEVRVTLGSSGKLTAQIKNGAPYQLFMAANMKYPKALYEDDIAITRPLIYAQGGLAMLSDSQKDFSKGINLVNDSSIEKIAVANPKTAPYGKASVEAMKNAGVVLAEAKKKFVYGESVSQTVSYAVTASDMGFVAKSSLYSPKMSEYKKGTHWIEIDSKLYTPINQGIVVLKNGKNNSEVAAFYAFMLSSKAKKIMEKFGYIVP